MLIRDWSIARVSWRFTRRNQAAGRDLGIEYSGALVRNRTTHLVLATDSLASSADDVKSQKIRSAESWGIAVIRYAWIEDSLAEGKVLDANKYFFKVNSSLALVEGYRIMV